MISGIYVYFQGWDVNCRKQAGLCFAGAVGYGAEMKRLKDGVLGKFVGDSALLWAAQMGGVFLSVLASIFVTRALGPEGRGVYTWLLTLAGIGSHVALFGLDTSNRRLAASEPETIPALLRLNIGLIFGLGAVVSGVIAVIALNSEMVRASVGQVVLAVLTVPLSAMMMAVGAILLAQQKIGQAALSSFLPKALLGAVFGAMVVMGMVSVDGALALNLLAGTVAVALPLWWLRAEVTGKGHLELGLYIKTVWRTCSATYLAGLAYYMMQKVDVLMIGAYLGEAPTGFYGVASNMADLMILPIAVIAAMLSTRIAASHKDGQATGLARRVVVLTMGLAIAGCSFTYLIAPWLIELLYGPEFAPAAVVLRWLCPAVVGLSFFMLMHNILLATGRARYLAIPALVGCLVNVGLNMVLIPQWGLVGACVASIVAYPLGGLAGWWLLGFRR